MITFHNNETYEMFIRKPASHNFMSDLSSITT